MSTVELEAPLEDVPERWREGRTLREGDVLVVRVTTEAPAISTTSLVERRKNALEQAAGVWSDRSDEEIEQWQETMRQARRSRFEKLFPESE